MTTSNNTVAKMVPMPATIEDQFDRNGLTDWAANVQDTHGGLVTVAKITFLALVVIGGIWGSTVKIGGAVISGGRVIAVDRNRVVQHLEGGILKSLDVREGDIVKAGQVVAQLDDTRSAPDLANYLVQRVILEAQLARRRAEVNLTDTIDFAKIEGTTIALQPRVQEAIASQQGEFKAQRDSMLADLDIIDTRIQSLRKDIVSTDELIGALNSQNVLYNKELNDFRELLDKGLIRRTQVYATERKVTEMNANIAIKKLERNQILKDIDGLESQKRQVQLQYVEEASRQISELQRNLNTLDEAITRLQDSVERARIKSPVDGTVFKITARTLGAVIQPGQPIMEIFPNNDKLTIEAYVNVRDIEQIHNRQKVNVVFPSNRLNPSQTIPGEVTYLSADAVITEANPSGNYIAHVQVDPGQTDQDILPGNLAEVYFVTEPKTFFAYMFEPITRFAFRTFKG
ncbi:HlyD family type I secretion periplasmic adaptor subunit [Gimibacter soli]|uniref:Membrane fusion protein (MFP) family protein n=1 Tax=Gimibacter soli TaxID=3024400 RepID=A0AAE9XQ40_9PROT|nr:HlyD family type I secretion periplasmic adaptor subunit [Gimibacter soli]WCL55122.1 HlyD family type I secretion periplasmic adaptor subunit [Gimibacter soli]